MPTKPASHVLPKRSQSALKPLKRARPAAPPRADEPLEKSREVERFLLRVGEEFESLSQVLQQIARYVESHRDQLALLRVQDVARNAQVQPSAVVRFAKHFGFSGYSAMRNVFRADMSAQLKLSKDYQARIRDWLVSSEHRLSGREIAESYIGGAIAGMQALQQQLAHTANVDAAVDLLAKAHGIWIAGTNRAFPVASYLAYSLQHTDKPVHWVAAIGAMHSGELRALRSDDVLIAISFAPYGKETLAAIDVAVKRGAKVLTLTDTLMSPLAKMADVSLAIAESSVFGFRSLTNTMVVAQSLFVALAYRLELQAQSEPANTTSVKS